VPFKDSSINRSVATTILSLSLFIPYHFVGVINSAFGEFFLTLNVYRLIIPIVLCPIYSSRVVEGETRKDFMLKRSIKFKQIQIQKEKDRTEWLLNSLIPEQMIPLVKNHTEDSIIAEIINDVGYISSKFNSLNGLESCLSL
jgi:hypothetical protein